VQWQNKTERGLDSLYIAGDCEIRLLDGDITSLSVDAIVNAANTALILGAGVAGAIREKGGPSIQKECDQIGGTSVGGAVITGAGNLAAKYVIHAVGPRMGEGDEEAKLKNATLNSLSIARDRNLHAIAFPAISTGIFGFPIKRCAEIMLDTSITFLRQYGKPKEVIFCLWGDENLQIFRDTLDTRPVRRE
jgi:O-acetyl-ADP-ribose deacetylase (regulator of RNase III)